MRKDREIEELIAQVQYRSNSAIRARIRRRLEESWQRRTRTATRPGNAFEAAWIPKLRPVAFAAAALIVLGVLGSLLHRSASPAYALEQTMAAVKDIRYFHFRFQGGSKEYDKEAWIEYDPEGSLRNVRVNIRTGDVKQAMVWSQGITQYLRWHTNDLSIFDDQEYTDKVLFFVRRYDPRQAIGYLRERVQDDGIQVQIGQPADGTAPITVTVDYDPNTYMIDKPMPRMRERLSVDPASKLIRRVQVETLAEGRYVNSGVYEYLDYSRPFAPGLFDLKREAPADMSYSVTTGIAMGIEQGSLSDAEVAVQLVRGFLEAWAAKDYERAAQIHGYMVTGEAQSLRDKVLQRKNILRVLSIDSPAAPERPLTGLLVPCTVEYEENGTSKIGRCEFRVSKSSRDRWRIRDLQQKETPPNSRP